VPRVANKYQQARGEYNLLANGPLHNFLISSCAFPFRHGARPVSTEIHLLRGGTRHKAFWETVETRRAACRQQRSTGKGGIQSFGKWAFAQFFVSSGVFPFRHGARPVSTEIHFLKGYTPQSLSVNRRDGACRVSPAKINKQGGNTIIQEM